MPVFILFDGIIDPIDYVYHIQLKMALNMENDSLMCKCFPTSLARPTFNWFKNLPRGSVDSFQSLCDRFISQYYGNKRPTKDISSLFTMKQHEDERLQAFLTRFNLTKSIVIECHPSTVVQAFKLAMNRVSTEEKYRAKIRQKQVQPQRQTSWKAEKRPREEELITPLKVTLARLYPENKDKFRSPLPIRQHLEQRNQSKHCAFHSNFGH
ncbi:uncharacterized protein LOC132278194 [Cornus florida]|uniref:uncharacterized protein LOC132278194 n=1 Tax=Cornus florida TaxID=4283 RepID=UPI00289D80F6|nr:uncharacterized protein LOC132278194 [Cornus florida]